jgi:hypothetical protein
VPEEPRGQAEVVIPQAWLIPNLNLDAVRALQPPDTSTELDKGDLRLSGVEIVVARNWLQDEFWSQINQTVRAGYEAEKTYTFMRVHSERRQNQREPA